MNIKTIPLILITLIFVACEKEKSIEIISESFTENNLEICKNNSCPEITINYLQIQGDKAVSEKINTTIRSFIIASLSSMEERPTAKTIEEAATNFIESYKADKARFPDMAGEYFAEISITDLYNSPSIISFEQRQYLYTGGAHGYGTVSFVNFDPKTGIVLNDSELFKNKKEFTVFAEKKFRQQQNINLEESINDPGFWFEDDRFVLPESVGFTRDTLIFVYNQYDIASYADGPIELKIARKEAEPYLKIK